MPPVRIAHYRVVAPLGAGAMGDVYRCVDERIGREVALKLLPRSLRGDRKRRARMLREARAAGALNHPGIVTLFDVGEIEGRTYLVMELIDGRGFTQLVDEGMTWQRAVELAALVADALGAAHARGVFHRDIKADNLMVTAAGQPKVLDFGLAKARSNFRGPGSDVTPPQLEPQIDPRIDPQLAGDATLDDSLSETLGSEEELVTADGTLMGTPNYMSPEQTYGRAVDARSEVFSLGIVFYELVCGRRPFDCATIEDTIQAVRERVAAPPSQVAPERGVPATVDAIALHALAKKPADRFPDMPAFAAALRAAIGAPAAEPAPPSRRRWWIAGGGAVAAIALAITIGKLASSSAPPPPMAVSVSNRLTFDPGCEEFPRFTPDGKSIVYDGLVDGDYELLALDRTSRVRRRLTHAAGWDYGASISHDGKYVAYVHRDVGTRETRVIAIEGDTAAPTRRFGATSGYPAWTRDGALLLGDPDGRIVRRELTGAERMIATLPAGAHPYHLLQLAGGDVVVLWFTSSKQRPDGMVIGELDGKGGVRVVEEGVVEYEGGLSPDTTGAGYYFIRKGATTANEVLWRRFGADGPAIAVPGGLSPAGGVDIARDGKSLVYSSCTEQQVLARLRGDAAPQPITRGEWHDRNPVRVDDKHVLISSDRDGAMRAWLLDPKTGEAALATATGDILSPSPSPDGRTLVFATEHGRGGLAIADGSGLRQLTKDPSDANPVFANDGATIVFERSAPGGQPRLWAMPADGGEPRPIAPAGSSQPIASPLDNTIVYVDGSDPSGTSQLAVVDLAGGAPRPLAGWPRGDWHRPRFSPDGKRVLAVAGLVRLVEAPLGGAPATVWSSQTGGVQSADYAPDGDGFIATISDYNGELWLAEGTFP